MSLARDPTKSNPDLGGWSSSNGVGLSNPQLAQGRRTMLDLVNRLHSTGSVIVCKLFLSCLISILLVVQCSVQVDIDLPQIAVIGSQSAGKSSLIEAISGITLPRAAGTCTRYVTFFFGRQFLYLTSPNF
jgi:Dynamin family